MQNCYLILYITLVKLSVLSSMLATQYLCKSLLAGRYQRPIYNTLVMQEHTLHIISERAFDTFSTHGNTVNTSLLYRGMCINME